MNDSFLILIHENNKLNGASELLDILAAIISGFATPLRQEHVTFFKNIIIPLHKVQTSSLYFENLVRCSLIYLTKDTSLAINLIEGILKYWPFGNFTKEILFLQELDSIFEICEIDLLEPLIPKLFKRIVKCISGIHIQVADKTMCLFENEAFIQIIKKYKTIAFNMLTPVIAELAENHWQKMLQESFSALNTILYKIDPTAYKNALDNTEDKIKDK
jgi:serine/threonine-protein phosphatase 2A regulatory subunit B'